MVQLVSGQIIANNCYSNDVIIIADESQTLKSDGNAKPKPSGGDNICVVFLL